MYLDYFDKFLNMDPYLFIDEGEILKIDTRSGEYIERVKS